MKKNMLGISFLFSILILAALVFFSVLQVRDDKMEQEKIPEEWGVSIVIESGVGGEDESEPGLQEWSSPGDVEEGDAPTDGEWFHSNEDEANELFPSGSVEDTRRRITALAEEYNELIPYGYQGRSMSYGYFKQEDGYKNVLYDNCADGFGLDGVGYMIWLFRNAAGHTPEEFLGDFSNEKFMHEVTLDHLEIGDICVTGDTDIDVDYGVVCGFVDGHAVVTMCDNIPNARFMYGCNHLAYIKTDYDQYLGSYRAVNFQYFYRLDDMCEGDSNEK